MTKRVWAGDRPSRNEKARVPAEGRGRVWSNAVAVAGHGLGGLMLLQNFGAILGVEVADFGLGVFVQLVGNATGEVIKQMPAGAFVNARLLFVQPKKDGAERVSGVVGQLVAGVSRAGFQPCKGDSFAGKKFGGEPLCLGLGAGETGKI